jgi:Uncharacterised protein family (UPF0236)
VIEDGYRVDGEVGRFHFTTHRSKAVNGAIYNTATEVFQPLKGKQWYRTVGFKEIAIILGDVEKSYRTTARLINRVRFQPKDGTPYRTLQASTESEGAELIDYLENKTTRIFKRHRFAADGAYNGTPEDFGSCDFKVLSGQRVADAVHRINGDYSVPELLENPVCFEDPSQSVNIAIDDVGVKRQTDKRSQGSADSDKPSQRKSAYSTVVRIDHDVKRYSLVGGSMKITLRYLIAFLLANRLLGKRFQFFTDGHTVLNDTIRRGFNWYPNWGIILDWFHLVKKCKEQLSLASRGRLIRKAILTDLMPLLWHGLTSQAIERLEQIEPSKIKNDESLAKLIAYLERNIEMIPCYALRKRLGLCNSSARGEKMNDRIVSSRQKHNGMSWSKKGSLALAALTAAKLNGEDYTWLRKKELAFKLAA